MLFQLIFVSPAKHVAPASTMRIMPLAFFTHAKKVVGVVCAPTRLAPNTTDMARTAPTTALRIILASSQW
jgi:hypothetical protein